MAAAVKSQANTAFTSASTLTITKPSGLAVGDLMICHYTINDATDTVNTFTGWTHEVNNVVVGGNVKTGLWYKIADSGDVAASNFTFGATGTAILGGAILRIDGFVTTGLLNDNGAQQVNSPGATYANTVTPTAANPLMLLFVAANENIAASNYAIVTSNPTWSEQYNFGSAAGQRMACASASRPQSTATGNSAADWTGGTAGIDSYGIQVAIDSFVSVTVTGSTGSLVLNGNSGTVTGTANVTGSTGSLVLNGNSGTVVIGTPDWNNQDKETNTWTDQTKS